MNKEDIVTPEQLAKAEKIVQHDSLLGKVAFMVAESLQKSYVEAHYRHTADGTLVFVHGYNNKVYAKPKDLEPLSQSKQDQAQQEWLGKKMGGKTAKKPAPLVDKYNSFHHGDEVFVRYSHMHDQHFGIGAVVGVRSDPSHDGALVGVRLLDGRIEYYDPESLVHIHKQDYDQRGHEESHHTDTNGVPIPYKHLTLEQRVKFYDLYKLFYRLHRMGEQLAFQENKHLFLDANGKAPTDKSQLTAEQKNKLESLNVIQTVPSEGLIDAVSNPDYNDGKHTTWVKKLLKDIEDLNKKGVPNFEFPKFHKSKSAKSKVVIPEAWLQGMFPSTVVEVDKMTDKDFEKKLKAEHTKLIESATGLKGLPSTEGQVHGDYKDFYHGQPIIHGKVVPVEEDDPGTVYEKAAKVPTAQDDKNVDLKAAFEAADSVQPDKGKSPDVTEPIPVVPKSKEKTTEPKLVVHTGEDKDISDLEKEFKVVANAQSKGFEGVHGKYIVKDSEGNEYLFKPYSEGVFRVWADIIAAKFAKAIGLPTAEMGSKPITLKVPQGLGGSYAGKTPVGSVQKIIPNLQHNNIKHWANADDLSKWKNAPKAVIEQLQKEHVMDWLLGNNDAHADQFVVDAQGNLVGIDKGQSFKFYQNDVLSLDYDPAVNKDLNHQQVYNLMLLAAKAGHIKLDWGVVKDFIDNNLSNVSALAWVKMVTPYAANSAKWGGANTGKFQALASKRKANAIFDFKKLYDSVGIPTEYNKKEKAFEKAPEVPKPVLPESEVYQPDAFHQIDANFHEKVHKAGIHGFSRMVGGGDIEDMSLLFTTYKWDKPKAGKTGKGLEVSFKLLPGSEKNIIKWFDNVVEDQNINFVHQDGTLQHSADPVAAAVIKAAMTVNHHVADGEFNQEKMNNFAKWFQASDPDDTEPEFDAKKGIITPEALAQKLMKGYITEDNFDDHMTLALKVANHYHKIASEIMDAVNNKKKTASKNYSAWSGEHKTKNVSVSSKKYPYATYPKFLVDDDGNMVRQNGEKHAEFGKQPGSFGAMFTKDLPGNIQVRYYPHYSKDLYGQNNLRAQQGNVIVDMHSWDGNAESMHEARKVLKDMGIDHRLANHTDMEVMYLTRVAWQQRADVSHKKEYKQIQAMENSPKKIEALKELCAKVYGKKPDELSTYDPTPKWDNASGRHHWWNPYVIDYLHMQKPKNVKVGMHNLTVGTEDEHLQNLAKHGLISIEGRHKFGWYNYSGMSVTHDQLSGGSDYVGLSAASTPADDMFHNAATGQLVFRPELFARADMFGYENDTYGSTHNEKTPHSHHATIADRMPIMDIVTTPTHLYEVRFKNRVPLDRWFVGTKLTGTQYGDYGGKVTKGWVKTFRDYLKKYRPHILEHTKFIGLKDE